MNTPLNAKQLYHLLDYCLLCLAELDEQGAAAYNDAENTLLAYLFMDQHIEAGGFVYLIAAGNGSYVFDNPLADSLRRWGIKTTPKILDKARALYQKHGADIERLAETGEDLDSLRRRFNDFETLDAEYYEICEDDFPVVSAYVRDHPQAFPALLAESAAAKQAT
ncbi:MAG: DMP19 family protein [Eikenella sp.]|nr:DMP19 family protein [Eikenella sp.]